VVAVSLYLSSARIISSKSDLVTAKLLTASERCIGALTAERRVVFSDR
jgi:hypothetical protein